MSDLLATVMSVPIADLGTWAKHAVGGSMPLALPVAALAGLVSFFSPCVLPLLPGYLSYATGLGASTVLDGKGGRGRMLAGSVLFVGGFTVVFLATGVAVGGIGAVLIQYSRVISVVVGVLAIGLGLAFAGWLPMPGGTARLNVVPRGGLVAAPLLGVVFGLGWTPCIGPALSVVLSLALTEGSATRGGVLAVAYALGLGVPFVVAGLAIQRLAGALGWVRRHQRAIQVAGGIMMIAVGVLLVSGIWDAVMAEARQWVSTFGTPI